MHVPREGRGEVGDGFDVSGQVIVGDGGLNEPDVGIKGLRRAEAGAADGDHVVVFDETVREIRPDKAHVIRDEEAFVLYGYASRWMMHDYVDFAALADAIRRCVPFERL